MNSEQKRAIKSTILECRGILEKDIEKVLINLGIYINEEWVDINNLTNLDEEQRKIRENIEQVIEKLCKGGFDKNKAIIEYIKEVAYTYLNRIAALRVLEVRGLIDEILISRSENGDKSFINSRFYEVAREYCKYNMDAGLSYIINLMFEEIGEEIKLLFSTEDEYSIISPSSSGVLSIIKLLCTNIDDETWKEDEIIGWIYQYFIENEKKDTFERAANENGEYGVHEVPAVTQFFTPDWIVNWIVDNSLGSLWTEMKQGKREGKKVEEIKLLDPCCGSGHFLVKAYDLFCKMYIEEGIYTKEEIPYKILSKNIHGIDIDLRAIQLTALILFIKTKEYLKNNNCDFNTKGKLVVNLVCADSILLNGNRLEALKEKHKKNKTIIKMLEIIYEEFEDIRLKGSLIQPEKKIFPLFEEYKNRIIKSELNKVKKEKKKRIKGQLGVLNEKEFSVEEYKSKRDFTKEEKELMESLMIVYNEATKANDISKQLFANETTKSIKLIDIFMHLYDVVVTNPPFMGRKFMNSNLKKFIDYVYENSKNDLYSVFIERCISLTKPNGFIGMITQNTFMFITTYKKVRDLILDNNFVRKLVHLGPRAFDDISGEKVTTSMYILEKKQNGKKDIGQYIKLDDIKNSTQKMEMLNEILKNDKSDRVFYINQENFNLIEGRGFVYWIDKEISDIFSDVEPLIKYAKPVVGFQSGKDPYFFRYFWEVKEESLGKKWVWCAKGGENGKYYKSLPEVVLWENNGQELKEFKGSVIRNENYYFNKGINSSLLGGLNYSARVLPENYLFNVTCVNVFPYNNDNFMLFLGMLNSSLIVYMLNLINPTLSITPGTLSKLPIKFPNKEYKEKIESKTALCTELQMKIISRIETSNIFEKPFFNIDNNESLINMLVEDIIQEYIISKTIDINSIIIDNYIFDLYEISYCERIKILENLKRIPYKDKYSNYDENNKFIENINIEKVLDKIKNDLSKAQSVYSISLKYCIDIEELYNYLIQNKVYSIIQLVDKIKNFISYSVGVIFNRWENFQCDKDGILPFGSSIYFEEDISEKIYEYISKEFGEENLDEFLDQIENILGQSFEIYLKNKFFLEHILMYQKRPIYWQICSPKKTFNCLVYYHKLDEDSLYKVKSIYLAKMIKRYEEDLKYYNEQLIKARIESDKNKEKDFKNKCSDLEEKLEDLNILDKNIMEILPYKPDLDQGVLYNIIPLEPILAARVSTDKEREEYYKEVKKK